MFTPPPSPRPSPPTDEPAPSEPTIERPQKSQPAPLPSPGEAKRRIGRRTRWTVLVVPAILILVTASTRYLTHPAAFDVFSAGSSSPAWDDWAGHMVDWRPHKRHDVAVGARADATSGSSAPSIQFPTGSGAPAPSGSGIPPPAPTAPSNVQTLPPVPTDAVLPTPFPQPFDSNLPQNFSSTSCFNFFNNMTAAAPFRTCRPFSLLLQTSDTFIQAQDNLTMLNTIVWGTCNTTSSSDQCTANMGWFAQELQTDCAQELSQHNALAVNTLAALQAYSLMRKSACLSDPATNTYCYLSAVFNANPSDLYFYGLPLGSAVPPATTPTCSACTKSLLGYYAAGLTDASQASQLTALKGTYDAAAKLAVGQCGESYAKVLNKSGAARGLPSRAAGAALVVAALAGWAAGAV